MLRVALTQAEYNRHLVIDWIQNPVRLEMSRLDDILMNH